MKAGAAFYNDPSGHKCEEALVEFRKAYALSESLNALKGMAVCNLELERDADAIDEYAAYVAGKGASLDAEEKAQVEADLNALRQAVATVTLRVDADGVRVVDVRTPPRPPGAERLHPAARRDAPGHPPRATTCSRPAWTAARTRCGRSRS